MSADAKVWIDGDGWTWKANHDGTCISPNHLVGDTLRDVLTAVEYCMGHALRWEFRIYPDGQVGLVGYDA